MANGDSPSLSKICALHFASIIGNGRVPPIDTSLPPHIGDDILKALHQLSLLTEKSLDAFTKTPLAITKFDSSGTDLFTVSSLVGLQKYKELVSINLATYDKKDSSPFKTISIHQFVTNCLSEESRETLRHLNLSGSSRIHSVRGLAKLTHLESLCISRRPVCSKWMLNAMHFIPVSLKCIDISDTAISNLLWLENLPNLEVLIMHNVLIRKGDTEDDLLSIKNLRVLDISKKIADYVHDTMDPVVDVSAVFIDTLKYSVISPWPKLRRVDMSGNALAAFGLDQAIQVVDTLIAKCPEISCISVLATPLDLYTFPPGEIKNVRIVNCSTRVSALDALEYYGNTERDVYASHALHAVYYCLQSSYDEYSANEVVRCAGLVCTSMKRHLHNIGVQMAGSACLYHLCKMKRIRRLTSALVQDCMNRCLDAAEHWRQMVQLQKNVWLTICNDYLLQLPGVNFYRTCKVALESMLTSRDSSVARMTIAIVSIVTPKMRPPEARELTGDERYVKFLVGMLDESLTAGHLNSTPGPRPETSLFTLKFTLSALWNLTDESCKTCEVFHKSGGIETCFNLLKNFDDHYNIQTKVLGILNNIAEVEELRLLLASNKEYIQILCSCLGGDFLKRDDNGRNRVVERSYFAAGVLANLLARSSISNEENREIADEIDSCLRAAVSNWPQLQGAMVSYRSFSPFARILEGTDSDGARMWCLWGILHVLSNKEKPNGLPYPLMLKESAIPEFCEKLIQCSDVVIHGLAEQILTLVHQDFSVISL